MLAFCISDKKAAAPPTSQWRSLVAKLMSEIISKAKQVTLAMLLWQKRGCTSSVCNTLPRVWMLYPLQNQWRPMPLATSVTPKWLKASWIACLWHHPSTNYVITFIRIQKKTTGKTAPWREIAGLDLGARPWPAPAALIPSASAPWPAPPPPEAQR